MSQETDWARRERYAAAARRRSANKKKLSDNPALRAFAWRSEVSSMKPAPRIILRWLVWSGKRGMHRKDLMFALWSEALRLRGQDRGREAAAVFPWDFGTDPGPATRRVSGVLAYLVGLGFVREGTPYDPVAWVVTPPGKRVAVYWFGGGAEPTMLNPDGRTVSLAPKRRRGKRK